MGAQRRGAGETAARRDDLRAASVATSSERSSRPSAHARVGSGDPASGSSPLARPALSAHDVGMTTSPPNTEVLLFDGFDDLDAVAPLEILTAAGFTVQLVRPAGHPGSVRSAHGMTIAVAHELGDAAELIVVPGGGWLDGSPQGVRHQCDGELPSALAALHARGAVLASVCTGALLLAAGGLLTGRPAVTNRLALDDLERAGAVVRRDARVVDDGDVVTSGGPASGLDLAVHLVERFRGPAAAEQAARRLEHTVVGPIRTPAPI